jgi:phage FluMu gp28-like protein
VKRSPEDIRRLELEGDREASENVLVRLPKGDLLLRYQGRVLDRLFAGTALLLIEKSRRIGLTWGIAAYLVMQASKRKSEGGQNGWYMGYDKDMTLEFIETCAMWARVFNIAAETMEEEVLAGEDKGVLSFSIRFASGNKITALPSVPRALRGKQGIFVADEAAFHKNVDEVLKAAMAFLIWGGQVIVISTHDGAGNPFNMLLDEVRAGNRRGEVMTIPFEDALGDGLYERVALVAKAKGITLPAKEQWASEIRASYGDDAGEELDCIPKAGSGSLINIEDIIACEHDDCGIGALYEGNICYVGRDVARRRDGQVQYCMEDIREIQWQRDTYEEVGQSFAHQDAFFDDLFTKRRIGAAWVDQTGMGEKVVEDAQIKHGQRVVGVLLTGPSRVDLALSLARRFETRRIRIRRDPKTRSDLLAIKRIGSEQSGGLRIVNEGAVHADRFWAYALASRAGDMPAALYEFQSMARDAKIKHDSLFGHPDDRPDFSRGSRFGAGGW